MNQRTLPQQFVELIEGYGREESARLLEALSTSEASVSIRGNALKNIDIFGTDRVPWLADRAVYLSERPVFAADPAWHQGLYYVQDASSMAMTAIVREVVDKYLDDKPLRYLDACAAPGGKSISAIEALPVGSFVVSNEYDRRRVGALIENLAKHGSPNVAVSCGDAVAFAKVTHAFDIVAVDAPCSGEGMMRKEAEAIAQWSPGLVAECAATQRHILENVWQALRPGGVLIYSTCTFNRSEDEDNVRWLIDEFGAESIPLQIGDFEGVCGSWTEGIHAYRFMPGHVRGEGLFVAAVRKPDGHIESLPKKKNGAKAMSLPAEIGKLLKASVVDAEKYTLVGDESGMWSAVDKQHAEFVAALRSRLKVLRSGLPVGMLKGKDCIPAWELAFASVLKSDSFPRLPLDREQALCYLHGDALTELPSDLPKGFALVTHGGYPLGFIKNIGRRANNLYPDALRLRLNPTDLLTNSFSPLL